MASGDGHSLNRGSAMAIWPNNIPAREKISFSICGCN